MLQAPKNYRRSKNYQGGAPWILRPQAHKGRGLFLGACEIFPYTSGLHQRAYTCQAFPFRRRSCSRLFRHGALRVGRASIRYCHVNTGIALPTIAFAHFHSLFLRIFVDIAFAMLLEDCDSTLSFATTLVFFAYYTSVPMSTSVLLLSIILHVFARPLSIVLPPSLYLTVVLKRCVALHCASKLPMAWRDSACAMYYLSPFTVPWSCLLHYQSPPAIPDLVS